tara:strand:- start:1644 stop:2228 length:585 start_codon:yes stop_codon:yes gene_type:complete
MQNIEHDIQRHDKYFITQDFVEDNEKTYLEKIETILRLGIKIIQFRSKNLSLNQYSEMSKKIFKLCKSYNTTYIINDYKNYENNKYCDGLQLTSKNLMIFNNLSKINNTLLLGSCHNLKEIDICNKNNFDMITISPVRNTHNKIGIGWEKFSNLTRHSNSPVFALGGLNYKEDINIAIKNGATGIAASTYFYKL